MRVTLATALNELTPDIGRVASFHGAITPVKRPVTKSSGATSTSAVPARPDRSSTSSLMLAVGITMVVSTFRETTGSSYAGESLGGGRVRCLDHRRLRSAAALREAGANRHGGDGRGWG